MQVGLVSSVRLASDAPGGLAGSVRFASVLSGSLLRIKGSTAHGSTVPRASGMIYYIHLGRVWCPMKLIGARRVVHRALSVPTTMFRVVSCASWGGAYNNAQVGLLNIVGTAAR